MIQTYAAGAASAMYARLQPEDDASFTFSYSRIKYHSERVERPI